MGMDFKGETYGAESPEYRNHATRQDMILSNLVPEWLGLGYVVLVTGDHGINRDHTHGGTSPDVRNVPLYYVRPGVWGLGDTQTALSQLQIAPTLCQLLEIPIPETMKAPAIG
jgi:predicted AlkP superfamily pyrophosphatase or phosphodiesterase